MKVDPRKIRAYLEEKDWRMTFSAPGSYDSYSMRDEEILVPANTDFATYAVNVRQILNTVSRIEGRSPEEVLADIEDAEAATGASVEYTVRGVRDGMIPAAVMEWLIGTHRDMTAAVCDGTEAYNVLGDVMMRVDGSDIRFLHGPRTAKAVPGNRVGADGLSHRLPSHTTVRAGQHTAVGPPFLNRFPIIHEEEHALFLQP